MLIDDCGTDGKFVYLNLYCRDCSKQMCY